MKREQIVKQIADIKNDSSVDKIAAFSSLLLEAAKEGYHDLIATLTEDGA